MTTLMEELFITHEALGFAELVSTLLELPIGPLVMLRMKHLIEQKLAGELTARQRYLHEVWLTAINHYLK